MDVLQEVQPKCTPQTTNQLLISIAGKKKGVGEDTRFSVTLEGQHDFRGTIPSRRDVLGHIPRVLFTIITVSPRQSKITDFKFAVGVYQEISWFQVAMEDVCRVNVFQPTEDLVDE